MTKTIEEVILDAQEEIEGNIFEPIKLLQSHRRKLAKALKEAGYIHISEIKLPEKAFCREHPNNDKDCVECSLCRVSNETIDECAKLNNIVNEGRG